ncbi:MAG: hypothetical protein SFV24_19195 [Gemmatimonadales bacterium]|nr:hypothetical protein [Gemmatimonadales bacterium]
MAADPILDALLAEAKAPDGQSVVGFAEREHPTLPTQYHPSGAPAGIRRVKYTHDAMIDFILANPCISQNELATHFGYTASWVSQIISSDAFQARLAERRDEIIDPTIRATVEERFKALVVRSMEILAEKLNKPSHQIPDNLVLRTLEVSAKAAGYGAKDSGPKSEVNVNVHLESLSDGLVNLLQRKRKETAPIEGEVIREG